MVVAAVFSRYELKVGLAVGSPSLVADARHVTTDLLASAVILLGIIVTYLGYSIDRYVALLVALLVARIGVQILVEAVKVLFRCNAGLPDPERDKENPGKPRGSERSSQNWRAQFGQVQVCGNIFDDGLEAPE